jgi:hypothetical protein
MSPGWSDSRACGSYQYFLNRGLLLTRKVLKQWFLFVKLMWSLRKIIRNISVTNRIYSTCRKYFSVLSLFMTYHRVCSKSNTTGDTNGAGTGYPSGAPKFTPSCSCGIRVARSLFLSVVIFRSLFIIVSFFFWQQCCLSFFYLRIVTQLVSSNSSNDNVPMDDQLII